MNALQPLLGLSSVMETASHTKEPFLVLLVLHMQRWGPIPNQHLWNIQFESPIWNHEIRIENLVSQM
jgi:hypothetical protein